MGLLAHLLPLFPREVVSNPTQTSKPAKKETRVSEAWIFFSRPVPAGESPRAGGLGEAARTPRVRRQARPGPARLCPLPVATPALPQALRSSPRGEPGPRTAPRCGRPGPPSLLRGVRVPYLVLGSPLLVRLHRPLVATTRPDLAAAAPSDASGSGGHGGAWPASRSRAGEAEAAA